MAATEARYDAATLRKAVRAVQGAVGDAEADSEAVAAAHLVIADVAPVAPPIVAQWIRDYLGSLSRASSREDVAEAVNRLAKHFKLPSRQRAVGFGEQGRLFE